MEVFKDASAQDEALLKIVDEIQSNQTQLWKREPACETACDDIDFQHYVTNVPW